MQVRYAVVEVEKLRPHEEVRAGLVAKLVDEIRRDGFVRKPVLVESRHFVILDGHHRYEALIRLECRRIPVYVVDYEDDGIGVTTWPEATVKTVTKAEVIERGLRGTPFPPKTTRHVLSFTLADVRVPIDELR
ncbi:MAG: ParB N-terminal domain-containing protein [Candidatus Thermoplasmatota archaeon]